MDPKSLKFHPHSSNTALQLPLALGHFLPWYTLKAADFRLSPELRTKIAHFPPIEDFRHWYNGPGSYRRAVYNMPEIGFYDSRDPATIRWQIESAVTGGLAGFIINWHGQNAVENVITFAVLDELERWNRDHPSQPFVYMYSVDSQAQMLTEGRVPVTLREDVQHIQRELMRPFYLCREGRPVFSCFPYENNLPVWINAFDNVFGKNQYDFLWMNGARGEGETGCFSWIQPDENAVDNASPFSWFDSDNPGANSADAMYRQWSQSQFGHRYGMAGVWPGFNDTMVRWAWNAPENHPRVRPRIIARETTAGNTYEILWKTYLNALADTQILPLPLVQIVTWNDWAESSTIEPSHDYGRRYIDLTMQFVTTARTAWRQRFG